MRVEAALRRGEFSLEARFEAPERGVVALFGRSGCGKTTLVNVIAGLVKPDHGRVEVGGRTWLDTTRGTDVPTSHRGAGYVFQESRLFPHLDVRRNLRYGMQRSHGRSHGITFDDIVDLLGVGPLLTRTPGSLSGGERRRVALGRALLAQPDLLLLDEPFAGLDRPRRAEFIAFIEALRGRLALPIVLVTHDFEDVLHLATHLVVMEDGRVAAQGPVAELGLHPALTSILGSAGSGAILDALVTGVDAASGLARVDLGRAGQLKVRQPGALPGTPMRLQLLARDVILARDPPVGLSVRNALMGIVSRIDAGEDDTIDVQVDIGGPIVMAHITREALHELGLAPGRSVHVLVKAVSIRGHVLSAGI